MRINWTRKHAWAGACAVLLGTLLAEGSAHAYYKSRIGWSNNGYGNGAFSASYGWTGETIASGRGTFAYGWGWDTIANQTFNVKASVFGGSATILDQYIEGESTAFQNGTPTMDYKKDTWMVVKVLGVQIANPRNQTSCQTDSSPSVACTIWGTSAHRSFFDASASYTIGIVPITVRAQVTGDFHVGGTASAKSTSYLGLNPSTFSTDSTTQNAGAYVTTSLSASAGIGGIAGVGVTAGFQLINVSISPTSSLRNLGNPATFSASSNINLPLTITTMGGSVDLWADSFLGRLGTLNLITWSGIQLVNQTMVNDVVNFGGDPNQS